MNRHVLGHSTKMRPADMWKPSVKAHVPRGGPASPNTSILSPLQVIPRLSTFTSPSYPVVGTPSSELDARLAYDNRSTNLTSSESTHRFHSHLHNNSRFSYNDGPVMIPPLPSHSYNSPINPMTHFPVVPSSTNRHHSNRHYNNSRISDDDRPVIPLIVPPYSPRGPPSSAPPGRYHFSPVPSDTFTLSTRSGDSSLYIPVLASPQSSAESLQDQGNWQGGTHFQQTQYPTQPIQHFTTTVQQNNHNEQLTHTGQPAYHQWVAYQWSPLYC
ncbi:hypothetical protein BDQ17DRAFT_1435837 [Cyathus striatus]|nr:hypothetical protein BDQ17DRAFT_1435837 [Cyathus striatus]